MSEPNRSEIRLFPPSVPVRRIVPDRLPIEPVSAVEMELTRFCRATPACRIS